MVTVCVSLCLMANVCRRWIIICSLVDKKTQFRIILANPDFAC